MQEKFRQTIGEPEQDPTNDKGLVVTLIDNQQEHMQVAQQCHATKIAIPQQRTPEFMHK